MNISHLEEDSFLLTGEASVSINPPSDARRSEIELWSDRAHSRKSRVKGPGEYEIGGVLIMALAAGAPYSKQLLHAVQIDGLNVLHVPRPAPLLSQRDVETIGRVDILIVDSSDMKAARGIIDDVAPRVVIPIGENAEEVCASLGLRNTQAVTRFTWSGHSSAPRSLLMKPAGGRGKRKRVAA